MFAAIRFFQVSPYILNIPGVGELPIDPWATLVCIGVVLGLEIARNRAIKLGLDVRDIVDGAVATVAMGFVVAHVFTVVAYNPWTLRDQGISALWTVREGFSSTGGFIGAVLGSALFYGVVRKRDWWRHADVIMFGFPVGWFFGRLGCGTVHDHIGALTSSPFGMAFPKDHVAAGVRWELGLTEAALMLPLVAAFFWWGRKDRPPGFFLAAFTLYYAPMRFVLDFLRNQDLGKYADTRFFGLTPAQYGMVVGFLAALALAMRLRSQPFTPWPMDGTPDQGSPKGSAPPVDPAPESPRPAAPIEPAEGAE